jgi:AAA15 family ATPase/GTPase
MILHFKVKNFRSYKDEVTFSMEANASELKSSNFIEFDNAADQRFKILKVALIYGANASGKTNIIRALYELLYLIQYKPKVNQSLRVNEVFKLDRYSQNQPSEYTLTFLGPEQKKYTYSFSVLKDSILEEELVYYPNGKKTTVFKRNPLEELNTVQTGVLGDSFNKKIISVFENQLILSKFGDDEPHELLSKVYKYFDSFSVINATNEKHLDSLQRTTSKTLSEKKELLKKVQRLIKWGDTKIEDIIIVKQIFDDRGKVINDDRASSVGTNPYDVYGVHNVYEGDDIIDRYDMEFRNWSHGTQSLYKLGGEIITTLENGGILIVDELDTSLHPFLTKMLLMMFQSTSTNPKNAQLIFTTHDVTLLDRDLIRRDQIWLAEKDEKGMTDLYSLQDFDDVREDTPFEKWYLAGKFGGLPKMNSVDSMFEFQ